MSKNAISKNQSARWHHEADSGVSSHGETHNKDKGSGMARSLKALGRRFLTWSNAMWQLGGYSAHKVADREHVEPSTELNW